MIDNKIELKNKIKKIQGEIFFEAANQNKAIYEKSNSKFNILNKRKNKKIVEFIDYVLNLNDFNKEKCIDIDRFDKEFRLAISYDLKKKLADKYQTSEVFDFYWGIVDSFNYSANINLIKSVLLLAKEVTTVENIKNAFYFATLNNEEYKETQLITFKILICFLFLIEDHLIIENLRSETDTIVDSIF